MLRRPPRSTRTDTLFPYTTLFRSTGTAFALRAHLTGRSQDPRPTPLTLSEVEGGAPLHTSKHRGATSARRPARRTGWRVHRSEEHTSELQSLMRISYAVFCLKKKKQRQRYNDTQRIITNKSQ